MQPPVGTRCSTLTRRIPTTASPVSANSWGWRDAEAICVRRGILDKRSLRPGVSARQKEPAAQPEGAYVRHLLSRIQARSEAFHRHCVNFPPSRMKGKLPYVVLIPRTFSTTAGASPVSGFSKTKARLAFRRCAVWPRWPGNAAWATRFRSPDGLTMTFAGLSELN